MLGKVLLYDFKSLYGDLGKCSKGSSNTPLRTWVHDVMTGYEGHHHTPQTPTSVVYLRHDEKLFICSMPVCRNPNYPHRIIIISSYFKNFSSLYKESGMMYLSLDSPVCVSTLSLLTQRSHPELSPSRPRSHT